MFTSERYFLYPVAKTRSMRHTDAFSGYSVRCVAEKSSSYMKLISLYFIGGFDMKETVSEIKKWIIAFWIVLMFVFKTFKNIILYEMDKINLYIYKRNMMDATYQCCSGLIVHHICDADKVINLYVELCDEIRKA